jgi:TnsA endonuclease N terminal
MMAESRKITNKGAKKVIGKFPSLKMGQIVWWESQLEQDYIFLLEFDPDVLYFKEQPLSILYELNGKGRRYTPDFLVERSNKRQLVEVKPEEHITKNENLLLFRAVTPIIRREGYEFLVASDRQIRVQPRLRNIKLLTKYARTPVAPQHQIYCQECLRQKKEVNLVEIVQFFAVRGESTQVVYSLIYRGLLTIDLMIPIGPDSLVRLP